MKRSKHPIDAIHPVVSASAPEIDPDSNPNSNLLRGLEKKEADLIALVLSSQGMEVHWEQENGKYNLDVGDEGHRLKVDGILSRYHAENPPYGTARNPAFNPLSSNQTPLSIDSTAKRTAGMVTLLLCVIHAATIYHGNHRQVVLDYGASALYILQGELYRTVTALTLHSDLEHLVGNGVGILILLPPLCSLFGVGRGLMLTLFSGAGGNFLNACLHRKVHLSIGSSTAVMGMIGILTVWQLRRHISPPNGRIDIHPSVLLPLGAGAALVGMLSGGENTDVSAHVLGFVAGVIIASLWFCFSVSKIYRFTSGSIRLFTDRFTDKERDSSAGGDANGHSSPPDTIKHGRSERFKCRACHKKIDTALILICALILLSAWFKIFQI